ncbi:Uncharacterized protein K02A2.6 [Araneus ventricosus]|uniref:RNA-directed DNA polymerase n=1 Tax=Araneus ventricosus TaxID=182803 RepID=A0A4Y2D1Q3_ARAVE|nr:Uncharacterized protein K02A2.6 [Araneus ventricosus]
MSSSWQAILLINDRPVNFKIYTGAQANIISKKLLNGMYGSGVNVRKTSVKLSTYTGQTIELLGCTTLPVKKYLNSPVIHLDFMVTKNSYQPILGLTASADKLGLIRKYDNVNSVNCCKSISNLLCKYNQVFEGLGNLPGKYRITLCENSVPVVSVTRKVSFSLLEPLKVELDRMVKAGVIEKVTEPTDRVSPLVIVQKKNGALRVCLDPQNLNRAIKRPQYNLPTFEDITSKLAGAKYFSVLDTVSAFWQISLDEERSRFCTFSSPFGRFKFLRMPYGIKCAPERFQRVVAEMLEDFQNADNFFDDLIVWGKTLEKHNETLEKVFKRCIEFNLKLSREKSQICQIRVTFLGHTLSSDGISVNKSKLEPILSMSKPEDRQSLHRYLGMINYLSKFLPNLSTLIAPLREIESEIVVDASPFGLGAVLQQRGKPIDFASSTLIPAQRNYAHIEKELLSVVYGCKKFHHLPISDIKLQEISNANKSDPLVQELKSLLECGWDSSKGVSLSAKKYLQYKDELHFVDDLLLKLDLIVVLESMRREILNRLQEGHFVIVKTISMARTCVFWSGISKDIKEMIEKYPVCAKFQICNAQEPEILHEFPTSPWVKVAIDFFYCNDSEEYSTSDAIPESTPTVRPQEPVDEPASNSQSDQESSSYDPISRSSDKGPYRTRYGRVVKPPSCYVAKF